MREEKTDTESKNLREIPKWTRRYAQNRTLTPLVQVIIIVLLGMSIAALLVFAGIAFMKGNLILASTCMAVLAAIYIFLFISIRKMRGKKIDGWMGQRLYPYEGTVSIAEPESMKKKKWLGYVVGIVFGGCFLGTMFLGMNGYFAIKYMQPISALYCVPFMIFLYFSQKPKVGPLMLLWPILYTIHAILVLVGVPISFTGNLGVWNMFLPFIGYFVLTNMIGHLYGRYALKKLKGITHLEGDDADAD